MAETIIETAGKYKEMADMIGVSVAEESFDDTVPQYIQNALLRLYYAIALEEKTEELQAAFSEETDEETVTAVMNASETVEAVSNAAFSEVDEYSRQDREFSAMIEAVSVNSAADGMNGLLYKLYKCEGIIRMAYRCAAKFPIYGIKGGITARHCDMLFGNDRPDNENDPSMPPEDYITEKLGIDIFGLFEIRQRLLEMIRETMKGKSG
ncbi:MAG: hypothetical protein PHO15_03995 [Eubacteriales bacterium]|nr:hypothetical protein [Eubacteriales bacterium]